MAPYGNIRECMAHMALYGFIWVVMAPYTSIWVRMADMALYGYV
jgi:hypothetical protein